MWIPSLDQAIPETIGGGGVGSWKALLAVCWHSAITTVCAAPIRGAYRCFCSTKQMVSKADLWGGWLEHYSMRSCSSLYSHGPFFTQTILDVPWFTLFLSCCDWFLTSFPCLCNKVICSPQILFLLIYPDLEISSCSLVPPGLATLSTFHTCLPLPNYCLRRAPVLERTCLTPVWFLRLVKSLCCSLQGPFADTGQPQL